MKSAPIIDKHLPVCRMGNSKKPKVVILTYNPKLSGEYTQWPEHTLYQRGLYSDTDMTFANFRAECKWWDDLLSAMDKYVSDQDVLHLELYPYHSKDSNIPPQKQWDNYEKQALVDNVNILRNAITNGAIVIGYYYGEWESMFPELRFDIYPHYLRCSAWNPKKKIEQIANYISKSQDYLKNL